MKSFEKIFTKHNSSGDWSQFAIDAQQKKWVQNIASAIVEEGVVIHPDDHSNGSKALGHIKSSISLEKENGRSFFRLPILSPFDGYFIHAPKGSYRF